MEKTYIIIKNGNLPNNKNTVCTICGSHINKFYEIFESKYKTDFLIDDFKLIDVLCSDCTNKNYPNYNKEKKNNE